MFSLVEDESMQGYVGGKTGDLCNGMQVFLWNWQEKEDFQSLIWVHFSVVEAFLVKVLDEARQRRPFQIADAVDCEEVAAPFLLCDFAFDLL